MEEGIPHPELKYSKVFINFIAISKIYPKILISFTFQLYYDIIIPFVIPFIFTQQNYICSINRFFQYLLFHCSPHVHIRFIY